jgi:hypothetical protein
MDCKRDSGTTSVDLQRFDAAATQEALDLKSFKVGRCVLLDWKMIGNWERKEVWKNLIHCGINILSLRNQFLMFGVLQESKRHTCFYDMQQFNM